MKYFAVINVANLRMVYCGRSQAEAEAANKPGTHLVKGERIGDAVAQAAYDAGFLRRG